MNKIIQIFFKLLYSIVGLIIFIIITKELSLSLESQNSENYKLTTINQKPNYQNYIYNYNTSECNLTIGINYNNFEYKEKIIIYQSNENCIKKFNQIKHISFYFTFYYNPKFGIINSLNELHYYNKLIVLSLSFIGVIIISGICSIYLYKLWKLLRQQHTYDRV